MFRTIMFIGLISVELLAETIRFSEGKFVESLELYTSRDGNISYDKERTTVAYEDGKTIVKNDDNVTVYDNNEILIVLDLNERPEVGLHFSLTKALFQKDFELLEENFTIEKISKKEFLFHPKGEIKKFIEKLELFLTKEGLVDVLKLEFSNGDKIKIEAK